MSSEYMRLIVIGANSGIGLEVANYWHEKFQEIILIVRNNSSIASEAWQTLSDSPIQLVESAWSESESTSMLQEVFQQSHLKTVVINFAAQFGVPEPWDQVPLQKTIDIVSANLSSFLLPTQQAKYLPAESLFIGFSGAGVGGPNVDLASLGYSLSKAAIAGIVETLDRELSKHGTRLCLIAPGAFPTRMQNVVATAPDGEIDQVSKQRAIETMSLKPDASKLVRLINFLINSPSRAGGRIWSAGRDNLSELVNPDQEFGKLRRN